MRIPSSHRSIASAWPLVVRELHAEARKSVNFWLRVLAAAVMIGVFAGFVAGTPLAASELGAALFAVLRRTLLIAIWIIVPTMTADCISREKREGTLGLLFLTPLTVLDVIAGKAATHILRATILLVASVPVIVLPFVLGGVQWQEVLVAITLITNALLMAIAAGIYASVRGGTTIQVMVMAEVYALGLASISAISHLICGAITSDSIAALTWLLITVVIFTRVIALSVQTLRQSWDQDSASEQPKWVRLFSGSEFWQTVFHWKRGRTLDRNPMAWLQEYSWTARLTKWGWCFVALIAGLFVLLGFPGCQPQLIAALAPGVAFSAAGSFRRDRQSGALEALLVTPLSVRQIIAGRMWGMCSHFIPALAIVMVCWNADRILNSKEFDGSSLALVVPNPLAFGALMVVGLYASLRRVNFLLGWILTWAAVFFLPACVAVRLGQTEAMHPASIIALVSGFQIALAAVCWWLLYRDIEERRFLSPEAT